MIAESVTSSIRTSWPTESPTGSSPSPRSSLDGVRGEIGEPAFGHWHADDHDGLVAAIGHLEGVASGPAPRRVIPLSILICC